MKRKAVVLAGVAVLVAALATGTAITSGAEQTTSTDRKEPANTATVVKGKLSAMVSVHGTLTYRARSDGSPYSVINQARGTYTELPHDGDKVDCGDVLFRVDDEPVLLLCGTVPAYRDLVIGHEGKDVRQLNRNLHRLGHDTDVGVVIDPADREFTWKTQRALMELQDDQDLGVTGSLDLDDAVFLPRTVRISKLVGEVGGSARPGDQVALATSDTLEVQVALDASRQGEVKVGDRAQVTLPGTTTVDGKVDRLGRVAQTADKDGDVAAATIPAFVSLDDPGKAREFDSAPVEVEITTRGVANALSVPVIALVGKAGGGFAVEVVRDGGQRDLVVVRLGLFDTAGGRVQVEGDLDAGDHVTVPSL